jgi:hypothetical protein
MRYLDVNSPEALAQRWKWIRLAMAGPAANYMAAGRADAIPKGDKGLWYIRKPRTNEAVAFSNGRVCPAGQYTKLIRWTEATLMDGQGECVMSDDPHELSRHLHAAMSARGNVLVTGLGLACVLRMLQTNPNVERITVVEISRDVIDLVWPHTPHDRVELIHADAIDFLRKTKRTWDCAWHDVWTDTSRDEPHLAVVHQWLMFLCAGRVRQQGAWAFPRDKKRAIDRILPGKTPSAVRSPQTAQRIPSPHSRLGVHDRPRRSQSLALVGHRRKLQR